MSDNTEDVQLSTQDEADLALMEALSQPVEHTLLRVWSEVLSNIDKVAAEKVSPVIANKIVSSWPKLSFQDVPRYHDLYHAMLRLYRDELQQIIDDNPGALKHTAPAGQEGSDAIENRAIYLEVLFQWHMINVRLEKNWNASDPDSHVQIAAIADSAAFTIGPNGLTQHLAQPQVGFNWGDEDQQALQERVLQAEELL